MREPKFENLLKVLNKQKPDRVTLFELFMNGPLYEKLAQRAYDPSEGLIGDLRLTIDAYKVAGYDYTTIQGSDFFIGYGDEKVKRRSKKTISLNEGFSITDWESYESFHWNNPADYDYSRIEKIGPYLPEGMKLMVMGPGGVLENVISIVGYDNLCVMLYEEPGLVEEIFKQVGTRMLGYYEQVIDYEEVGFICSNDDWGFNTQTFLSPEDMRKYVFPWHKKIVELAHSRNKPCILHSCGNLDKVMEDIIENMKFDGKHSYEDNILSVEEAYEKWGGRIAILGGIDVNVMTLASPGEIKERCKKMVERTKDRGGYALGTGNSVPEYIPQENYMAMISAACE